MENIDEHPNIMSLHKLLNTEIKEPAYVVDGYIHSNSTTVIVGKPGTSKSFLGVTMGISICYNEPLFGLYNTIGNKVLYIDEENALGRIKERVSKLVHNKTDKEPLKNFILASYQDIKLNKNGFDQLDKLMSKYKPDIVFLDSLIRFIVGSENDSGFVKIANDYIKTLIIKHNCAFVVLHHARKGSEVGLDMLRGSSEIAGFARSILIVTKYGKKFTVNQIKNSYDVEADSFTYTIRNPSENEVKLHIEPMSKGKFRNYEKLASQIENWIIDKQIIEFKRKDIQDNLKSEILNKSQLSNAINYLINESGLIKKGIVKGYYNVVSNSDF